jgi:hypothetical protein
MRLGLEVLDWVWMGPRNIPARISRRQFGLAAAWASLRRSRGQESTTFSTDVKVVNLLVTEHQKSGQIVRDLTKDDFSVTENGRTQSIRYFSRETDLPLTLGLMVDTSYSQRRLMDAERGASSRFLDQVLRGGQGQGFPGAVRHHRSNQGRADFVVAQAG